MDDHDENDRQERIAESLRVAAHYARGPRFTFTSLDLLVGIAFLGVNLGAYTSLGMYGLGPALLLSAVALIFLGRYYRRRGVRLTGRLLVLPASLACLILLVSITLCGLGPRLSMKDWPVEIYQIADTAKVEVTGVRVYCLGRAADEYVWRQRIPEDKLAVGIEMHASHKLMRDDVPAWFLSKFPLWWRPSVSENCQFFANSSPDEGFYEDDGMPMIMMYDPDSEYLYVWTYFEF